GPQASWRARRNPRIRGGDSVEAIVAELGAANLDSRTYNPREWGRVIAFSSAHALSEGDSSLRSLLEQCMELGSKDIAISFQMMVTHIKLAVNIQHIRTMRAQTLQELYDAEIAPLQIKPSYRTFQHWHTTGTKFAALAGGGTVYFLVLVAGLGLRTSLASMPGDLACHLGNALRHPDPDTMIGRTIIDKIIPVIHMLRGMFPITIDPLFPSAILTSHNLPSLIDCADIATSDLFFDSFIFNTFRLVERSNSPWDQQQFISSDVPQQDSSVRISTEVINTSYDGSQLENRKIPMPQESAADTVWTERERELVANAEEVNNVDSLRSKLESFYVGGVKPADSYIFIPNSLVRRNQLELRNSDQSLMAYICGSLPNHLRSSLMTDLILSFGDLNILIDKDTNQGTQGNFQAVHFSWYNRQATRGLNAPTHVQPYMLEKDDIRFNYSQLVPYISSETLKNQALYEAVSAVFADLFDWIKEHLKENLPAEYEILIEVARELPCNS
ncbi:hypothetical protein P692DRAFT_20658287, partial [Suillus brevipes Sb2]